MVRVADLPPTAPHSLHPRNSSERSPSSNPWSVRGGQGRRRQGSGCGGGAAGRVGAGAVLSCIFSRLQRRNFSAGLGAVAPVPQRLPGLRGGEESRNRPRQVPWARIGALETLLSLPFIPCGMTGSECAPLGRSLLLVLLFPLPPLPQSPWSCRVLSSGFWNCK